MKRIHFFLFLVAVMMAAGTQAQSAKQYYKAGEDFLNVANFEDAIDQFTKAIEIDPDYDKAYIARASAYEKLNNYKAAAEDFERAIVFDEKNHELYYMAGYAYYKVKNNQASLANLNKAVEKKSNYLEAYQVRSQVYLQLERYEEALEDCKKCLRLKENEQNYYNLAQVYEQLGMLDDAEQAYRRSISKNSKVTKTHLALANLLYAKENYTSAMASVNNLLRIEPKNIEGILLQAELYSKQGNFPKAIEVLSVASIDFPDNIDIYTQRGDYYMIMNQAPFAIHEYNKALELDPDSADLFYKRAGAYEAVRDYKKAMTDYEKLLSMSEYDGNAQRLYAQAEERLFELNRESDKPVVKLLDPVSKEDQSVDVARGVEVISVLGVIEDESRIKSLKVNDFSVPITEGDEGYEFMVSVSLRNSETITVEVSDVYDNAETTMFHIRRTEVDPPVVQIIAPYASENNILYLDSSEPIIYVEGKIMDESKIKNIYIDSVAASYIPSDQNPSFSATVRIENKSRFTVSSEDEFGNTSETVFTLNRDAIAFTDNPMGKTWAVFIENSNYESFASLEGPTKDVTMMKSALAKYQVHNYIHKKDMSKQDLQRFFAIELRDLIRSNRVTSLLIWYAGHGKFINETGYWVPVDAQRDDEFTYFSVNALKASMQSYPEFVTHTLVITDACESGPSFYQAMRSGLQQRNCDDWEATRFKSSQVFSSAGYELAVDNSQFTRTFANTLANNPDACLPIENIVQKVTTAVVNSNQQKPQFGKIAGLEDENGTFFFIPKDY